jgi:hypothetical protein
MRHERLLFPLLLSLCLGAFGLGSAACGGSSSSGAAAGGDCYDYTSFASTTPAVKFSTDVLPIFRQSCGISSSCHGCDGTMDPTCTSSGFKPFLGTQKAAPPMSAAQIKAIFDSALNQPAGLQASAYTTVMVGNPTMSIVKPGDPKNSFMMYKLDGSFPAAADGTGVDCMTLACAAGTTCGPAMPSGGPALPAGDRDTIRRWIAQGAQNN